MRAHYNESNIKHWGMSILFVFTGDRIPMSWMQRFCYENNLDEAKLYQVNVEKGVTICAKEDPSGWVSYPILP